MAYIFDITVTAPLENDELISRILDFKDDLHRECFRGDDVSVLDGTAADSALAPLSFSVRSKEGLALFTRVVKKSLAHHCVENAVKVSRR